VASFTACSDDDSSNPYAHESTVKVVGVSNLDLTSAGGEGYIVVDAPAGATVTSSKDWATATMVGDTVKVSVDLNSSLHDRNAVITIAANGTLSISGGENTPVLTTLNFTYNGPAQPYTVTGVTGTITAIENAGWLTTSVSGSAITITPQNNNSPQSRSAIVTVYDDDEVLGTIKVVQAGTE
jgi:hypothetical protein